MQSEAGGLTTPKMGLEGALNSKMKGTGNLSSKDMIFRADKIDLKSLDTELERHLSRVFSRSVEAKRPKEEWEIDLAKLDLRYVVANGAYGTVYRGTYDDQDVAGICTLCFAFLFWLVVFVFKICYYSMYLYTRRYLFSQGVFFQPWILV